MRAATELTIEGGWAAATIPRIAERADVAPRTVSTWFPTKDEILFEETDDHVERAIEHLRGDAGDVVDRLEAWLSEDLPSRNTPDPDMARLRRAAIEHDPELRARDRQHFERLQDELAAAVGREIGTSPDALGPQVFSGAAMAFLWKVGSYALQDDPGEVAAVLREGYDLLRAILRSVGDAGR